MGINQCDKIGPFFAFGKIVYFGQPFVNDRSSPNSWATFSTAKVVHVLGKMGWAAFCAMVSQNHLVTLAENAKVRQHLGT
jgi:hypothetical protein